MKKMHKNILLIFLKLMLVLIIFFSLMIFPKQVFEASLRGLNAWWTIVLPALLPFFIMSQILVAFGIVQFLGNLLEPVMRPIFRLPGTGAFVLAVGYTSGSPISAIVTADLRKKNLLTRNEAERIICFTNNASPLFMFSAVGVGMFKSPEIGLIIAISHYLANIFLGICLRFWAPKNYDMHHNSQNLGFKAAFKTLIKDQLANKKPLGGILGDAIKNSLQNIAQIGGFIILFSALIELLTIFNIIDLISMFLTFLLSPLMFDFQLGKGIASGFVEMTIGSKLIAESSSPLHLKVAAVCLILGWSGLSIHAQALSMLATTDIRFYPFVIARFFHGILSAVIALLIYNPTISAMSQHGNLTYWELSAFNIITYSWVIFIIILAALLLLSLLLSLLYRIKPILRLLFH